jgi:molybdopterin synthase catalytic subunit
MIRVTSEAFDPAAETSRFNKAVSQSGAVVTFLGQVRGQGPEGEIASMTLEHYPGMTERALEKLEEEARRRWPLDDVVIIHRHGKLEPGEPIVFVATASPHRRAAYEANEFLVDWLKTKAPFWKKEEGRSGAKWVDAKTDDDDAAARWE